MADEDTGPYGRGVRDLYHAGAMELDEVLAWIGRASIDGITNLLEAADTEADNEALVWRRAAARLRELGAAGILKVVAVDLEVAATKIELARNALASAKRRIAAPAAATVPAASMTAGEATTIVAASLADPLTPPTAAGE
jgi:hypothetical protein